MRKLIATATSALAVAIALLAGTGSAQAEPASVVNTASRAPGYEYYDWYWTIGNCTYAGQQLMRKDPSIITYKCSQSAYKTWYLYLLR